MCSALQPHLFRILPPMRKRPPQGKGVPLPFPGLLWKPRTFHNQVWTCSPFWPTFHPDPTGQGSPKSENNVFMYFLGISVRVLGSRACQEGCADPPELAVVPSLSCSKASLGHHPQGRHRDMSLALDSCPPFLVHIGPSFDGHWPGLPPSFHLSADTLC